jgi:hypothetical protein
VLAVEVLQPPELSRDAAETCKLKYHDGDFSEVYYLASPPAIDFSSSSSNIVSLLAAGAVSRASMNSYDPFASLIRMKVPPPMPAKYMPVLILAT